MKIAVYTRDETALADPRVQSMRERLALEGCGFYRIRNAGDISSDTDIVMSVGGDGTFLSASKRVGNSGIPVLGINTGRVGFLSEYGPEEACEAIISKSYTLEDRALLETRVNGEMRESDSSFWPYTLNEISVLRGGASILGVDVCLDGNPLPTYWADGLLVSTSSGSTAYSLSVGGPICVPDSKVIIIAPIAPHNLNVRPLVVPDSTVVSISMRSLGGQGGTVFAEKGEARQVEFHQGPDDKVVLGRGHQKWRILRIQSRARSRDMCPSLWTAMAGGPSRGARRESSGTPMGWRVSAPVSRHLSRPGSDIFPFSLSLRRTGGGPRPRLVLLWG